MRIPASFKSIAKTIAWVKRSILRHLLTLTARQNLLLICPADFATVDITRNFDAADADNLSIHKLGFVRTHEEG